MRLLLAQSLSPVAAVLIGIVLSSPAKADIVTIPIRSDQESPGIIGPGGKVLTADEVHNAALAGQPIDQWDPVPSDVWSAKPGGVRPPSPQPAGYETIPLPSATTPGGVTNFKFMQ